MRPRATAFAHLSRCCSRARRSFFIHRILHINTAAGQHPTSGDAYLSVVHYEIRVTLLSVSIFPFNNNNIASDERHTTTSAGAQERYCETEQNGAILWEVMDSNEATRSRDPYLVKSVMHSSQLLRAFRASGEALPLREVAKRSGLPKSMAFRLLYTLEKCGMVEKVGENLYQSCLRPFKQKLFRFGYASQAGRSGKTGQCRTGSGSGGSGGHL